MIHLDLPAEPLDVIILGTRQEFDTLLAEIGYNEKSTLVGFYHFKAKKLVIYDVKTGADIQMGLAQADAIEEALEVVKTQYDERVHAQINEAKKMVQGYELRILGMAHSEGVRVIRHEGGHQLFHMLGITPENVYSGGWLIEGIATYCEPDPIGGIHVERLMLLRYELERSDLMPLEYLLNFARGTELHRMDPLYANVAYAQSWAFIYFLMTQGYKEPFFNFLKEMRQQGKDYDSNGERLLLEKHLGKNLKEIEQEFSRFVKQLIRDFVDEEAYQDFRFRVIQST